MNKLTAAEIVLRGLYFTGALALLIVAYRLYLKRFKRNKLVAMNAISLITSKDNIFSTKTKFLILAPSVCDVKVELLDKDEKPLKTLIEQEVTQKEFPFDFDPAEFDAGKYYIYLTTDNAKIMRSITIAK